MGLGHARILMICSAILIQITPVTDRQMELAWHIRAIAYMLSRIKMPKLHYYSEASSLLYRW